MRIFKQLLLLVAVLLASSLSLDAITGGGLGQNPHPAVLVSGQPQQCGQFHHFHSGSFHGGNRHFVPMNNRHFVPMFNRQFVPMDNRHFVPMDNRHFVPMDNRHFILIRRMNNFEVIRVPGVSDQPFDSGHVHFVRRFDPRTGLFLIQPATFGR
ncbi:hypothetical protein DOZ80_14220 [Pseudomonas fluorescens]|uniref:Uncharacterized protein n=1 Tax=Pseudomonas fluorescens TaxID=294 RepID=A0A327N3L3_PSEFL|nr:hypothetical protein [Pseudomonas fluorescens]RAI69303.1 hypothetical protein DOZ80_14220 [Pseudomonas fluorescens]